MATLKNTTINDTGYMGLPVGTTAQRPVSPSDGMMRRNTTLNCVEYYSSVDQAWVKISDNGGSGVTPSNPATSATAILLLNPSAPSGYYYIRPDGTNIYYVYCDMVTGGGGWMLMINARPNNGSQYVGSNDYGLSSLGAYTYPEFNKATTSMWGTTTINNFFKIAGYKYGRMTPGPGVNLTSPFTGLHQRIGTTTLSQWPGSLNECSSRGTLAGSTYSWVLTQYQSWSDALAGTNPRTGTYTGASHYYPTTYDNGWQNFWKGDQDGIRFSTAFNSEDYAAAGQNSCPGYWWIKTT
jgi:hypothetical protein